MAKVLVIEDDDATGAEMEACLSAAGHEVRREANGAKGLKAALGGGFDAITLDRMLPGLDGLEVVGRLHAGGVYTPVLMVSALSDVDERIAGLRAGGDDYLTKPFDPGELVARLEVMLRRRGWVAQTAPVLAVGDLELDLVRHSARRGAREIELLPMEFKLLEFMMRNAGQTLSRRLIFETVWEYYFDPGTNLIEVYVSRLRKAIDAPGERPLIHTVRGQGYKIDAG
jgi:two-component system, OmpR family, response regulator